MSRSQTELNADLQRDTPVPQERKSSSPLMWLLLLLVVLAAGAWWFGMNRHDIAPTADVPVPAAPPSATGEAADTAPKPSQATARHRARPKAPAAADHAARLMADTPKPKYPPSALRAGTGGTVTLNVQVDSQGEPLRISIAKRSGNRDLDRAALTAASHWRFEPAMRNGKTVATTVQVPVEFSPQ